MLRATRNTRAGNTRRITVCTAAGTCVKYVFVCIFKTRKKAPEKYV